MLRQLRSWIHGSRTRQWTASLLGAAMLLGGLTLAARSWRRPTPPDLKTSTNDQIFAFLDADYSRMGSADREAFARGMAQRLIRTSQEDRQAFAGYWNASPLQQQLKRQIDAQVSMAMARRFATEYHQMPADQRGPFLDRLLLMADAIGPRADRFLTWLDTNPMDPAIRDPLAFHRDLSPFQRQIVLGTTATERAQLVQLGGDLLQRARDRRR